MATEPLIRIDEPLPALPALDWRERLERLERMLRSLGSVVVAYSGGVDSSVLLRVAHEVLGSRALGVIGRSESYAARELALALDQAASFGARIEVVATGELRDEAFRSNSPTRCYHCKNELYRRLEAIARRERSIIVDGTIVDDGADWRPGRRAADDHDVRSPLAELGFGKVDVRQVAEYYGLASHDKPASPCLASRVPYGTEITREILTMVERAEELLRSLGFTEMRVRHHGDVARIEVPVLELGRVIDPATRQRLVEGLKALGYRYVALDLEGFRSGSLNRALEAGETAEGAQRPTASRPRQEMRKKSGTTPLA